MKRISSLLLSTLLFLYSTISVAAVTLDNVRVSPDEWVDLCVVLGVPQGTPLNVVNVGASDVALAKSVTQPDLNADAFRIVQKGNGLPFITNPGDECVWALSRFNVGLLSVRELNPTATLPRTSFGEVSVASPTPVVQILGTNGLTSKVLGVTVLSGTVGADGMGEIFASSGTDALSLGALSSSQVIQYRPGQGLKAMFTARFSAGLADSLLVSRKS